MDINELRRKYDMELARQLFDACQNTKDKYLFVKDGLVKPHEVGEWNAKASIRTTFFTGNRLSDGQGAKYTSLKKVRGIIIRHNITDAMGLLKYYAQGKEQL